MGRADNNVTLRCSLRAGYLQCTAQHRCYETEFQVQDLRSELIRHSGSNLVSPHLQRAGFLTLYDDYPFPGRMQSVKHDAVNVVFGAGKPERLIQAIQ